MQTHKKSIQNKTMKNKKTERKRKYMYLSYEKLINQTVFSFDISLIEIIRSERSKNRHDFVVKGRGPPDSRSQCESRVDHVEVL